jgi:hypothetical protein
MLHRSDRPWGAIDCRQPRYPQKISEDRRFCDPALRQVCLCQRSADRPRSTHASGTDTARVPCLVPPFPETTQACTAWAKYRHTRARNKCEFVAHHRQNPLTAIGAGKDLESYQ